MFEIVKQEWFPHRVKVTHLLPKIETRAEAEKYLSELPTRKNISYEIKEIENDIER